jgi:ribosomal protein S18 acetylase RimI-like enzyme
MHTPITYPPPEADERGLIERFLRAFRQEGTRFSYQHSQVAAEGAEVVGLILSFGGRDEARLNAAVGGWLTREARDDEWYVDALAVFKNRSREGVGTRLLQCAEDQARRRHYPKIALNVAQDNTQAKRLYIRLGYVVTEETVLYGFPYLRMIKTLDEPEPGANGAESTHGRAL